MSSSDAANGASAFVVDYDEANNVTTFTVDFRFDGASMQKILDQRVGVGGSPGAYYSRVNPGYEVSGTFARGSVNYDSEKDEMHTPAQIEAAFEADVPACSAFYYQYWSWTDEETFCASAGYWNSTNLNFWQDYAHVEYKKDGVWVNVANDNVNFASPENASQIRSIAERLVAALGLGDTDELQYGVNWRVVSDDIATAWIYRPTWVADWTQSEWNEYFKIESSVEAVFDCMTVDQDGEYIYQPTLTAALASNDTTVIVNKDTEVGTLIIPAGKTVIEREGEITILDPDNSEIEGGYEKKSGLVANVEVDENDEFADGTERVAIAGFVKGQIESLIESGQSSNRYMMLLGDGENNVGSIEKLENSLKLGRSLKKYILD